MGVEQLVTCSAVVSGLKLFSLVLWNKILLLFCSQEKLRSIASYLNLVPPLDKAEVEDWFRFDRDFLLELLVWSLSQATDMYICIH